MAGHAFISYVHESSDAVNRLQWILESAGIQVWRDTADLWPGEDWRSKIREAITDNALVFVACFSSQGIARESSYQIEELGLAIEQLRQRHPREPWLIPVRFDDCDIPDLDIGDGHTLTWIQHADLFGDHFDEGAERLVTTILRILKRNSPDLIPPAIITQTVSDWIATNGTVKRFYANPPSHITDAVSKGQVATFYSCKGQTGRTMALANIGWIIASNGFRVLLVDCSLEPYALYKFMRPFLETGAPGKPGVVDLIRSYAGSAARASEVNRIRELIPQHAGVESYALSLNREFPADGRLDVLFSARQDREFGPSLSSLDWDNFYGNQSRGAFLDALAADMRHHYDYTLIDSLSGMNDLVDILTVQIPDVLVDCFTFNAQNIRDAAGMIQSMRERYQGRHVRILPVPMRVRNNEYSVLSANRKLARTLFGGLLALPGSEYEEYWQTIEVPDIPYYESNDKLAVFSDHPNDPQSLLRSYGRIVAQITQGRVTGLPLTSN